MQAVAQPLLNCPVAEAKLPQLPQGDDAVLNIHELPENREQLST
jgi:hypothetical protein